VKNNFLFILISFRDRNDSLSPILITVFYIRIWKFNSKSVEVNLISTTTVSTVLIRISSDENYPSVDQEISASTPSTQTFWIEREFLILVVGSALSSARSALKPAFSAPLS